MTALGETFTSVVKVKYDFGVTGGIEESFEQLQNVLAELHGVRSRDAVERFDRLLQLSVEWIDVLGTTGGRFAEFLSKTRTVVAGTCVGIGQWHAGVTNNLYDWVIIDEAARATPSELAVALQVGRRVLLVGDHRQLPPTYDQPLRDEVTRRLQVSDDSDVFKSDFERGFTANVEKVATATLLTQYRMAPAVGSLVSECFYEKELKNGRGDPPQAYELLPQELRSQVLWIDTSNAPSAGEQRSDDESETWNPLETKVVMSVLQRLFTTEEFAEYLVQRLKPGEQPIGVVGAYARQCIDIEKKIYESDWLSHRRQLIKVGTIDSYQGKENRIIVLSLTRNNRHFIQGYLRSPNRLNVAMSRAQERLIIVGAMKMWLPPRNQASPLARVADYVIRNQAPGRIEIQPARAFL